MNESLEKINANIKLAKENNLWFCRTIKGLHGDSEIWFSPYEAETKFSSLAIAFDCTASVNLKDPHEHFHALKDEAEKIKMQSIIVLNRIKRAEQLNAEFIRSQK